MTSPKKYGKPPINVVVVHGGPGAVGEMAPVAEELCSDFGVLEPFQTKTTVDGQVEEFAFAIENHASLPATLIGYSWGAWLVFMLAARFPSLVKKLVLVSSGPFEDHYTSIIMQTRMKNLNKKDRLRVEQLLATMDSNLTQDKNEAMEEFGSLITKADSYSPIPELEAHAECQFEIYNSVWFEAAKMRKSGELLEMGQKIKCPVVAIHGDVDPHPEEGVRLPLSKYVKDFKFILLDRCGHTPWIERFAREKFFEVLRNEIA